MYMVCQRLNKVAILPTTELTLNLVEEALKKLMHLQKNLIDTNLFRKSDRSRAYLSNFINPFVPIGTWVS